MFFRLDPMRTWEMTPRSLGWVQMDFSCSTQLVQLNHRVHCGLSTERCTSFTRLTVFRVGGFQTSSSFKSTVGIIRWSLLVLASVVLMLRPTSLKLPVPSWLTTRARSRVHTRIWPMRLPITRRWRSRNRIKLS